MPSSISSSERIVPASPWGRIWGWSLIATVVVLAVLEAGWRMAGYTPSIVDDQALWSSWRARVESAGPRTVVALGESRMQLAFNIPEAVSALPGYDIIQLSIDGRAPAAALRDIADNTSFAGIVLCSIDANGLDPQCRDEQQEYIDYYHNRFGPGERINRALATVLQERLAMVNPLVNLRYLTGEWVRTRSLPNGYLTTYPDRMRLADYTRLDIDAHRSARLAGLEDYYRRFTPAAPDEWLASQAELERCVQAIRDRGGNVAFIFMPTGSGHAAIMEQAYPRALYWDRFAAATGAITLLFQDEPSLSGFDTPDDSHLDRRDTPRFTRALISVLRDRGLFEGR